VSNLKNDNYEFLIALHELVEYKLITEKGIRIEDIDRFDKKFEADRLKGKHSKEAEPGDALDSPYRLEHQFATYIEGLMAVKLGVDWIKYSQAVLKL
jgi:hypothetical protein